MFLKNCEDGDKISQEQLAATRKELDSFAKDNTGLNEKLKATQENVSFYQAIVFFSTIVNIILLGWNFRTRDTTPDANAKQKEDLIKAFSDLQKNYDDLRKDWEYKKKTLEVHNEVAYEVVNINFCPLMKFLMSINWYGSFYKVLYVKACIKWTVPTMIFTEFVFWNVITFIFMVIVCVVQNVVQKQTLSLDMISTEVQTSYDMITLFWYSVFQMMTTSYEMLTTLYKMMTEIFVSVWGWLKPHLFAILSETQKPAA